MKENLSTAATGVQGSGWGWLGFNKEQKRLQIATCANQDPLEPTTGIVTVDSRISLYWYFALTGKLGWYHSVSSHIMKFAHIVIPLLSVVLGTPVE